MKVSVIIPCFNEGETVLAVLDRVCAVEMPKGAESEVILVDDGSTDGRVKALQEYERAHNKVLLHVTPTNLGKGAAVRIGLGLATGDIVVIQDADLELKPEELPTIVEPILSGEAEVVFGSRFMNQRRYALTLSYAANRFLVWMTRVLYWTRLTDMETCYKAFRRKTVEGLRLRSIGFEIEPELTTKLLRTGHKIREVPISYTPRTHKEGKKIRAWDGVKAVYYLLKYRFQPLGRFVRPAPTRVTGYPSLDDPDDRG